ncbi:hypothetical protein [Synechococcus sp. UW179A]|nr:hypothetical protein [Synechococcus sp. UW179A]
MTVVFGYSNSCIGINCCLEVVLKSGVAFGFGKESFELAKGHVEQFS